MERPPARLHRVKTMSGWARRVTIVGEVQGIEDEDERKEPPNWYLSKCQTWKRSNFVKCYFRALRKLFIVVVLGMKTN